MTSETEGAGTGAIIFTGKSTIVQGYQGDAKGEAKLTWSKSKGKGKVKVDDTTMEEARMEKLKKLKVEIAVLQELVDQLES
jgi:nitrogen regulatory protein PII